MSIVVNGTKTKNVVFNGKNAMIVQNKKPTTIFAKAGCVWTKIIIQTYFNGGARYANGLWVACSDSSNGLYWSEDGKTWTLSNISGVSFPGGARYANGLWVACCGDNYGLCWSEDGKTWTRSNITSGYFNGGARYANGLWVACGSSNNGLDVSESI